MTGWRRGLLVGMCVIGGFTIARPEAQDPAARGTPPPQTGRAGGGRPGGAPRAQGTLTPMVPDARGWGWQVKASISPNTPRPFYNKAKELLFQDQQVTSYTITSFNTDLYCEVGKHFDYIWFEMQHSTMSFDEVRRMIQTCPRVGAAPMIRMPDALEANMQKATDLGVLGVIVPTVDDAIEARDAAGSRGFHRWAGAAPAAAPRCRSGTRRA